MPYRGSLFLDDFGTILDDEAKVRSQSTQFERDAADATSDIDNFGAGRKLLKWVAWGTG